MLKIWKKKDSQKETPADDPVIVAQKKAEELDILRRMDTEARQTLQGDNLERYLLAKELGLERQAEIARIEGLTNTTFCELMEQKEILRKSIDLKLGYSVGGKHYHVPHFNFTENQVTGFRGKMSRGAMLRFQELKNFFDEMMICSPDIGVDPFMYGKKEWQGEVLFFLVMTWE